MTTLDYPAGSLVNARGRDWLVLPGSPNGTLLVRPLGGHEHETTVLLPDIDDFAAATFEAPTVDDRGDAGRARLLRDALRLSFRASGGPFRSFARLAVTPRNYQLVPLMMAANQDVTRLLIADGVGIGKTVEAGLIAAELLATGETQRLAVLCSPQLAPQWQSELRHKFGIDAQLLLPSTVNRLMRSVPFGSNVYQHHPYLVISTDFIKQKTRRDEFALHCPELVIVDEAHTCVAPAGVGRSSQAHLRYALLRKLADDHTRHLVLLTATPHSGDDTAWQALVGLLDDRLGDLPADLSGRDREDDRKLHPTLGILGKKSLPELCDLLQWSDLIVFDYLTANLDRLVNNMFNRQWNAEMMNNPAHNLERTKGGSLVFLDNESGLFHGYRLLEKYHSYHESLLASLCVFRARTANAVKVLHKADSVGDELHKLFSEGEVHHRHLPSIPEKNVSVLKDRLAKVYDQIVKCEALCAR